MTAAGEVLAALVAIDPRAAHAWPFLLGIAYAQPGTIVVGLDGTTLRIREDGARTRCSPAATPTAARRSIR